MALKFHLAKWILACFGMLSCLAPLGAQSYQSSFEAVKFDRAKGPATFNAGVSVDAASGAASMEIPFGPGIGARGLQFQPILSFRSAPHIGTGTKKETLVTDVDLGWTTINRLAYLYLKNYGSSSFKVGTLDLPLWGEFSTDQTAYSLPGGGGGATLGTVPSGMDEAAANQLLGRFAVEGSVTVQPGFVGNSSRIISIQTGSGGELVLGLKRAGANDHGTDEVQDYCYQMSDGDAAHCTRWEWPRRYLVVQGGLAYEFAYVSHRYTTQTRGPLLDREILQGAHYVLVRMLNRFGERIEFTYDPDGLGYTAAWRLTPTAPPSGSVRVQVVSNGVAGPAMPALRGVTLGSLVQIRVSYEGVSNSVGSYLLEAGNVEATGFILGTTGGPNEAVLGNRRMDKHWGWEGQSLQPVKITSEGTGEAIEFVYAKSETIVNWDAVTAQPTILKQVKYPNRTITLSWDFVKYRPSKSPCAWGETRSYSPRYPAFAYGVVNLTDKDNTSGQARTTMYSRVTPQLNWVGGPAAVDPASEAWVSRDFYTAITHPDGQISLHRFVEPAVALNAVTGDDGLRNLAYLKHVERETRWYAAGAAWKSDLSVTAPSSSTAYKWTVKDHLSLRTLSNPNGDLDKYAVPYATRTRNWEKESGLISATETAEWSGFAWARTYEDRGISSSPDLAFVTSGTYAAPGYSYGTSGVTVKTMDPKVAEWLFNRVGQEAATRSTDTTGYGTTAGGKAPVATTRDAVFNTVQAVTVGDSSLSVTTTLGYQGGSGLQAAQLSHATLTGPGLALSGSVGVSAYGYDANGFLNSISIKPNESTTLTTAQDQDELGRPTAQYDANGLKTQFHWDAAGRLDGITPPNGEVATSITYHEDFQGLTLTRGAQVQELQFNGFGELALERRKNSGGAWSHRIFGYDAGGRKTGETVWIAGRGDDHETQWTSDHLTWDTTITVDGEPVCKAWGPIDPDTGERTCKTWTTVKDTQTLNAQYPGDCLKYDTRGRLIKSTDPNGISTQTAYGSWERGAQKQVTVGSQTTTFRSDARGRLVQVLDALSQKTEYAYDASDRNVQVKQYGADGLSQTRTWVYNGLGWLNSLTQPESGTTSYSAFDVSGKPWVTDYNGLPVQSTYDAMGRVLTITGTDEDNQPLSQAFTYDGAGHGRSLGKLTRAVTNGGVARELFYDGLNGRLSRLLRQVDGFSFEQSLTYDSYGNIEYRGYPSRTSPGVMGAVGATQLLGWDNASGLPSTSGFGNLPSVFTYDPTSWSLTKIQTLFGSTSSTSEFTYGADQSRLATLKHNLSNSVLTKTWTFGYDTASRLVTDGEDTYTYDPLGRLSTALVVDPFGSQALFQSFGYDAFGNRIRASTATVTNWTPGTTVPGTLTTISLLRSGLDGRVANLTLDANDPALLMNRMPKGTAAGDLGTGYDLQGNLKQIYPQPGKSTEPINLTYDALGRVKTVSYGPNATRVTEGYLHDDEGLRIKVIDSTGKIRYNIYNESRQLIAQFEKPAGGSLTWKKDIAYVAAKEMGEVSSVGSTNVTSITLCDHQGSPRYSWDGTTLTEQKFLPFGEQLTDPAGMAKIAKGYTNHEQTDASNLIYMQARFYIPHYGRFLSPDPARDQHFEETQSWNIYSYVRNSPIMMTDPTGMLEEDKPGPGQPQNNPNSTSDAAGNNFAWVNSIREKESQTESVGQLIDRKGTEAALNGNHFAQAGWALLSGAYETLTPGGDRLSSVNAKAWNGEEVSGKELAVAGGSAIAQVTFTAAPQLLGAGKAVQPAVDEAVAAGVSRAQPINLFKGALRLEKHPEAPLKSAIKSFGVKVPGAITKPWHISIGGHSIPVNPFNPLWKMFKKW